MYNEQEHDVIRGNFLTLHENSGETGETFLKHFGMTYTDGTFDAKTKHLMAMCGAIAAGCYGCIIGQARRALDLGATKNEMIEVCMVAVSLGGTMAGSNATGVIQLMKDRGML